MFERHGRILTGRHPELLHTYTLPSRWPLYLMALPGAPTGLYDTRCSAVNSRGVSAGSCVSSSCPRTRRPRAEVNEPGVSRNREAPG